MQSWRLNVVCLLLGKLLYVQASVFILPLKQLDAPCIFHQLLGQTEDESLTGFVLLVANDEWPSTKSPKLWEKASEFLQNICGSNRTSKFVYNSYILNAV